MAIGMTIGNMAQLQTQSSMAIGQAQADSMGLGQSSANALAVTNLMGGSSSSGLVGGTNSATELGAGVVTQTLNTMNKAKKGGIMGGGLTPSFETQQAILGAGLADKGSILNTMG